MTQDPFLHIALLLLDASARSGGLTRPDDVLMRISKELTLYSEVATPCGGAREPRRTGGLVATEAALTSKEAEISQLTQRAEGAATRAASAEAALAELERKNAELGRRVADAERDAKAAAAAADEAGAAAQEAVAMAAKERAKAAELAAQASLAETRAAAQVESHAAVAKAEAARVAEAQRLQDEATAAAAEAARTAAAQEEAERAVRAARQAAAAKEAAAKEAAVKEAAAKEAAAKEAAKERARKEAEGKRKAEEKRAEAERAAAGAKGPVSAPRPVEASSPAGHVARDELTRRLTPAVWSEPGYTECMQKLFDALAEPSGQLPKAKADAFARTLHSACANSDNGKERDAMAAFVSVLREMVKSTPTAFSRAGWVNYAPRANSYSASQLAVLVEVLLTIVDNEEALLGLLAELDYDETAAAPTADPPKPTPPPLVPLTPSAASTTAISSGPGAGGAPASSSVLSPLLAKMYTHVLDPKTTGRVTRSRVLQLSSTLKMGCDASDNATEKEAMSAFVRALQGFVASGQPAYTRAEWAAFAPVPGSMTAAQETTVQAILGEILQTNDAIDGMIEALAEAPEDTSPPPPMTPTPTPPPSAPAAGGASELRAIVHTLFPRVLDPDRTGRVSRARVLRLAMIFDEGCGAIEDAVERAAMSAFVTILRDAAAYGGEMCTEAKWRAYTPPTAKLSAAQERQVVEIVSSILESEDAVDGLCQSMNEPPPAEALAAAQTGHGPPIEPSAPAKVPSTSATSAPPSALSAACQRLYPLVLDRAGKGRTTAARLRSLIAVFEQAADASDNATEKEAMSAFVRALQGFVASGQPAYTRAEWAAFAPVPGSMTAAQATLAADVLQSILDTSVEGLCMSMDEIEESEKLGVGATAAVVNNEDYVEEMGALFDAFMLALRSGAGQPTQLKRDTIASFRNALRMGCEQTDNVEEQQAMRAFVSVLSRMAEQRPTYNRQEWVGYPLPADSLSSRQIEVVVTIISSIRTSNEAMQGMLGMMNADD